MSVKNWEKQFARGRLSEGCNWGSAHLIRGIYTISILFCE